MTISIPADKIVQLIKQTCDANLAPNLEVEVLVEEAKAKAKSTGQALGNIQVDTVAVARANACAVAALTWVKLIVDGIVDLKPPPGQPE